MSGNTPSFMHSEIGALYAASLALEYRLTELRHLLHAAYAAASTDVGTLTFVVPRELTDSLANFNRHMEHLNG